MRSLADVGVGAGFAGARARIGREHVFRSVDRASADICGHEAPVVGGIGAKIREIAPLTV